MELEKGMLVCVTFMVLCAMVQCRSVPLKPVRLCGFKLPNTLSKICNHQYNRPAWDLINTEYDPISQRRLAKRDVGQGIVEECCLKPCSVEQLMAYCGNYNNPMDEFEHRVEDRSAESPRALVVSESESTTATSTTTMQQLETTETAMRSSALIGTVAPETLRLPRTIGNFWGYD